jgi:predicted amidohydrolase YtcJ
MKKTLLTSLFLILMISTNINSQESKKAFINGKIYTVNEAQPYAEAVVTSGNKIIFVGSNEDAKKETDSLTTFIDLHGKLMLPGFNDAHVHFLNGGFYVMGIDLRETKSIYEFRQILKKYVASHKGKWIVGGRWDHEKWKEKRLPAKEDIDDLTPDTPVLLKRLDGHMALTNSYGLKLAGITKDSKSPAGGLIEKDSKTGEPTGILKDNAIDLVNAVIPDPIEDDYYEACLTALNEAKKYGITSVQDITYNYNSDPKKIIEDLYTYQQLENDGKLTCRIYTRLPINDYQNLVKEGIQYNFGDDYLKIGSLKAYADGSLGSSTAWFFDPYVNDSTNHGLPNDIITDGRLEKWALDADKHKLQISVHAIGDHANSYLLDLVEKIEKENPEWDRRFRIEHAQHVRPQDIPRFAKLGVIASVQPTQCIEDGSWAAERIGPERIKYTHQYKSFLDNGVHLVFGTDWPVVSLNPLLGIYAAATRRTVDGKNPNGWIPEQKISVEDAIKCYTLNNAYAEYSEKIKGSIEPGKLADFVVLSDDILTIDPVKIKDVKVDMTILDGKIIYKRE